VVRPLISVTLAAGALVLSACGSASRVQLQPAPRLPRSVAASLASRSDALASALRRGDSCAAKTQVHGLERQTRSAIASGRVPAAYRQRLLAAVTQLATRVPRCVPPPPQPPPPPPPDHHKKHGDDHKKPEPKKHGGEGD